MIILSIKIKGSQNWSYGEEGGGDKVSCDSSLKRSLNTLSPTYGRKKGRGGTQY